MKTLLLKPSKISLNMASELLKKGEVVAIPTETVYGLAGNCCDSNAIKKIFEAKNRPMDNPLIVHISKIEMLNDIVSYVSKDAKKLAKAFWPGPLTIIMPKGKKVCNESCANLDSVGVRMPSNKIARDIIDLSGIAFSAPSANLSGKPSPTNSQDVYQDMNGRIPLIIDGGECEAGVESTVISVIGKNPIILRPGVITKEMIENILNKPVLIDNAVISGINQNENVLSPGMKYKHYAPNAEVKILKGDIDKFVNYVKNHKQDGVYVLCFDNEEKFFDVPALSYGDINDAFSQAKNLFKILRKLDKLNAKIVYARCPEKDGVALAVYNRLIRSAGFNLINL